MLIVCVGGDYLGGDGEAKVGRKELRTVVVGLQRASEGKRSMARAAENRGLRLSALWGESVPLGSGQGED